MVWDFEGQVIVQGIVNSQVLANTLKMKAYGAKVVAGIGTRINLEGDVGIPIFDLVEDALSVVGEVEASLIDVPPYEVLDAGQEAIAAGIKNLIVLTKNIPPLDIVKLIIAAQANQVSILGPNTPGLIVPGKVVWGNLQTRFFQPGNVGIIGYSEYLIYEVAQELNIANVGQSLALSLGQEKMLASEIAQWVKILDQDPHTEVIVWIEKLSNFESSVIKSFQNNTVKPIIVYLVGSKTLEERAFKDGLTILKNHLSQSIPTSITYTRTVNLLKKAKMKVAKKPIEIHELI